MLIAMDTRHTRNKPESSIRRRPPVRGVQWRIMIRQLPLLLILFFGVLYWLENHLAKELLAGTFSEGDTIRVDADMHKFIFEKI